RRGGGDAGRRRVAAVALARRHPPPLPDVLLGEPVELDHRDPGPQLLADHRQRVRDDLARAGHALDLDLALAENHLTATCSSAAWISAKTSFGVPSPWILTRMPWVRKCSITGSVSRW